MIDIEGGTQDCQSLWNCFNYACYCLNYTLLELKTLGRIDCSSWLEDCPPQN